VKDNKIKYIENLKVGQKIAFETSYKKLKTGLVTEVQKLYDDSIVITVDECYFIKADQVVWIDTDKNRFPRFVRERLKDEQ